MFFLLCLVIADAPFEVSPDLTHVVWSPTNRQTVLEVRIDAYPSPKQQTWKFIKADGSQTTIGTEYTTIKPVFVCISTNFISQIECNLGKPKGWAIRENAVLSKM